MAWLTPVSIDGRQGLERLLRYCAPKVLRSCTEEVLLGCARHAFAQERLRQLDPEQLVYESKKPGPGGKVSVLITPHQLLDRLSAPIPPPRRHRHRYYGVLAPNSPWRSAGIARNGNGRRQSQSRGRKGRNARPSGG